MKKIRIADGIHMLTMNVEDILFEGIWEIANGVTLNSFIVQGGRLQLLMELLTGMEYLKPCIGIWRK